MKQFFTEQNDTINDTKCASCVENMEWIDFNLHKPTDEDIGKEFLVAVKNTISYDYEIAEWYLYDEEDGAYFSIKIHWCGQQTLSRKVTHWCKLPELPID